MGSIAGGGEVTTFGSCRGLGVLQLESGIFISKPWPRIEIGVHAGGLDEDGDIRIDSFQQASRGGSVGTRSGDEQSTGGW
jgi:hypothetical protein